ncbi:flavin monoamine oxidase family protein [Streptococcus sp. DD12]|uniref:flavin monoamine oxidase family protein n=1 Tax=Streptococcus sp. DD12 TaxID=1777880 RepID=UPI00079B49CB|nr:FAD-dependent oxidoreductase [Streptococcus sp. DD12]KXT75654.1 Monoamine oxidase [Streptococcus sp. DD12]
MKHLIVGAGLSGLYMAYQLEKAGEDYLILEGKDQVGGRAKGLQVLPNWELELGATWFWPDFDKLLASLIDQLGLETFDQPTGTYLYEESNGEKGQYHRPFSDGRRVSGGMSQLIQALLSRINTENLHLKERVKEISLKGESIQVLTDKQLWQADKVFLALPPRLAATRIAFSPQLPDSIQQNWLSTDTWMAPHAKYLAEFSEPFWRQQGLTGNAMSHLGPLVEIHDISDQANQFGALFGFFGIPSAKRQALGQNQLKKLARAQLVRLFGMDTLKYLKNDTIKDWSQDAYLATSQDQQFALNHPQSANNQLSASWQNKLVGIASEFAPTAPGFLSGALEAVNEALKK